MLESLSQLLSSPLRTTWLDTVLALVLAYIFGQLLSWVYEATYHGLSYSRKFADALTLLTCISCAFVQLVQRSLLAGLGLVAVVSLVRFRANVKAPHDLVFIMASATFGLGSGLLAFDVTAAAFAAFAVFALFLSHDSMGSRRRFDGVLRLRAAATAQQAQALEAILARHCTRSVMLADNDVVGGGAFERSYQVKFKDSAAQQSLLDELRAAESVRDVRLLLQELSLEY